MSDPHKDGWREDYFLKNGLDYILALYYYPTLHHFKKISADQVVHFPWAIPASWISSDALSYSGQRDVAIFGASHGAAYTLRNWCRRQPGVRYYDYSGVENKVLTDYGFFKWLMGFDAVIAAGSEDNQYRLTTPKYFEIAAAGCLLFAQVTDDLDLLGFIDQRTCITFSQNNFQRKIEDYLANPENYRWLQLRLDGRELIRERHTIVQRLSDLKAHVERWRGRS
ncbi:MAG: glycosyltransferase family 1 protein [Anaerolineales bacterium]|nr:glycosyltransferase family 1 protein [Anaerolineales bacterium]